MTGIRFFFPVLLFSRSFTCFLYIALHAQFFFSYIFKTCIHSGLFLWLLLFGARILVGFSAHFCKRNDLIEFDSFICSDEFICFCLVCCVVWLLFLFIAPVFFSYLLLLPLLVLHNKYQCAILLYEFSIHKSNLCDEWAQPQWRQRDTTYSHIMGWIQCNYTLLDIATAFRLLLRRVHIRFFRLNLSTTSDHCNNFI